MSETVAERKPESRHRLEPSKPGRPVGKVTLHVQSLRKADRTRRGNARSAGAPDAGADDRVSGRERPGARDRQAQAQLVLGAQRVSLRPSAEAGTRQGARSAA